MPSHHITLQPLDSGTLPFSVWLALLVICSALGIVLRQVVIPTYTPYVNLTPGFVMPLFAGMLLGPLGGVFCGIFVGMSGALWEPFLIPLIGNIALGLSTGLPSYFRHKVPYLFWILFCVVLAISLGGFLPTFAVEVLIAGVYPLFAALSASIDAVQAGLWAVISLLVLRGVVQPLLNPYRQPT
ncbi:MAG: hypothetical protein Q6361_00935, partial [Candidatus Hermodarchaeota archaeon]|nr:hypothetical protein [Candidatus Hermodarchaeota archaeon]